MFGRTDKVTEQGGSRTASGTTHAPSPCPNSPVLSFGYHLETLRDDVRWFQGGIDSYTSGGTKVA